MAAKPNPTLRQPGNEKDRQDSTTRILAALTLIADPFTVYLIEMLVNQLATIEARPDRDRPDVSADIIQIDPILVAHIEGLASRIAEVFADGEARRMQRALGASQ